MIQVVQSTKDWLIFLNSSAVNWIEKNQNYIPFSSIILWYLRLPILSRLVIFLLVSILSRELFYMIGVIVLQSKARNEVLSIATAFQGEIKFPNNLYDIYAFMYFSIATLTTISIGIPIFGGEVLYKKRNHIKSIIGRILIVSFYCLFCLLFAILIIKISASLTYYLLYSTKNSSPLEIIIRTLFLNEEINFLPDTIDYDKFSSEIFVSCQLWIILVIILLFIMKWLLRFNKNQTKESKEQINAIEALINFHSYSNAKGKIWELQTFKALKSSLFHFQDKGVAIIVSLLSIIVFVIFILQILFQFGSFGKTLNIVENDFVSVEYVFNKNNLTLSGVRIYQDQNYLIIRDKENVIHYIKTEEMHVKGR